MTHSKSPFPHPRQLTDENTIILIFRWLFTNENIHEHSIPAIFSWQISVSLTHWTFKWTTRHQGDIVCIFSYQMVACATVSTRCCVIVVWLIRCEDLCEGPIVECRSWAWRDPTAGIHHRTDRSGGSSSMTPRPRCCSTVSWAPKTRAEPVAHLDRRWGCGRRPADREWI